MTNDRLLELVAAENKSWDETIDALGGKGNVPIRYLLNLPEKTYSETEVKKTGGADHIRKPHNPKKKRQSKASKHRQTT